MRTTLSVTNGLTQSTLENTEKTSMLVRFSVMKTLQQSLHFQSLLTGDQKVPSLLLMIRATVAVVLSLLDSL